MKPSKYLASVPQRELSTAEDVKPLSECGRCGWIFAVDNNKPRHFDSHDRHRTRREPRTEIRINVGGGPAVTRCCDCYEQELWHAGRHTMQGHAGGEIYRAGLKP